VNLGTGDVLAYEAFCHLDPTFASAPTSTLFRAAASLGLTEQLDRTCRTMALDGARGLDAETMLFINVSPGALASPEFDISDFVAAILRAGLSPGQVVVDVTDHERTLGNLLVRNLAACQEAGLRLSLDDFGDTTSDLNVLASLPFDFVKIDMGVIRGDEEMRRRLILGLLVVAREIGARLLAEGVETMDELRLVTDLGFEAAQGFYIKDPGPSPLLPKHVDLLPTA
jgi:EAL domain-containing protein (putative c-di-GMP-specific phosphodiesterase class I)